MDRTILERLAGLCGIEPEYVDIWGNHHRASDDTLTGVLRSMGLDPDGNDSALAEAGRLEERPWRSVLPPLVIAGEEAPSLRLPLRLPAALLGRPLSWEIAQEDGERLTGTVVPAASEPHTSRDVAGETVVLCSAEIPERPPCGYHTVRIVPEGDGPDLPGLETRLAVTPGRCHLPEAIAGGGRVWGLAAQLYALRSERNWGIGDYTDLRSLVAVAARAGAAAVGLSPVHALFPDNPAHASPYCPSSRSFLNVLHLDVEAVPEFRECTEARDRVASPSFRARLDTLRRIDLIDYPGVADAKFPILAMLYRFFRSHHLDPDTARGRSFRAFLRAGGERLRAQGVFEALRGWFARGDPPLRDWREWPESFRRHDGPEVARFSGEHRDRVEYHLWLQWQAESQLRAARRAARDAGMALGIYQDLAVGADAAGADSWFHQDRHALGMRIGAPPDDFNPSGQDWGLPPLLPHRLRETAYEPFLSTLRACMRNADVLRIDHVMGLMRLFWVTPGRLPSEGVYVRYPLHDLLALVALESVRNRCMVVGEDLGTVPDEVRGALGPMGILSYQLLYFSRYGDGRFRRPGDYPEQALAAVTTHDLPTLAGYWRGRDIEVRTDLELFPSEEFRRSQIETRASDRGRLLHALGEEGLLPGGIDPDAADPPPMDETLATAIHRYLARSRACLDMVQMEDVMGQVEQVNLPGTVERYPNWRRKLPFSLEELSGDRRFAALAGALRDERGPSPGSEAGE